MSHKPREETLAEGLLGSLEEETKIISDLSETRPVWEEVLLRFPFLLDQCLDAEDERWALCQDAYQPLLRYCGENLENWRARHNLAVLLLARDASSAGKVCVRSWCLFFPAVCVP
jgi:hypothetical protein